MKGLFTSLKVKIMSHLSIVKNPIKFREAFLLSVKDSSIDKKYLEVIHVFLYYVWRGAFGATGEILQGRGQPDLNLICLSVYKAFLPIIQVLRLGYSGDALVLLRALMERIAILGYLNENQNLIRKYNEGKTNLNKEAMPWAKKYAPEHWMLLYGYLSNIAHSRKEGTASHIFEENPIGNAFLYMLPHSKPNKGSADLVLLMIWYAIGAIDPITLKVLHLDEFQAFPNDATVEKYVSKNDLLTYKKFLAEMTVKYGATQSQSSSKSKTRP